MTGAGSGVYSLSYMTGAGSGVDFVSSRNGAGSGVDCEFLNWSGHWSGLTKF